jgi:hypothetical protein
MDGCPVPQTRTLSNSASSHHVSVPSCPSMPTTWPIAALVKARSEYPPSSTETTLPPVYVSANRAISFVYREKKDTYASVSPSPRYHDTEATHGYPSIMPLHSLMFVLARIKAGAVGHQYKDRSFTLACCDICSEESPDENHCPFCIGSSLLHETLCLV